MNLDFTPRLTTPAANNKAYINVEYGGKNHAILGNPKGRVVKGSVLPNCTGYVHGRVIELIGDDSMLCRGNAENYWDYTQDGFERGQTPIVGAIGCVRGGKAGDSSDGPGHVFTVEDINSHGDILKGDSGWSGTKQNGRYFRTEWLRRVNGTYAFSGNKRFQGFIYPWKPNKITVIKNGVYRMYNKNSGEHLFTANNGEANSLARAGWQYERLGWRAPKTGGEVYRVYNPNSGEHMYTMNKREKDELTRLGWQYEGIAFYSAPNNGMPIYRLYNENKHLHHFTAAIEERKALESLGWKYEGIAFYGLK